MESGDLAPGRQKGSQMSAQEAVEGLCPEFNTKVVLDHLLHPTICPFVHLPVSTGLCAKLSTELLGLIGF